MEFFQSTLFSNIVALLAFSTALYSIYYTRSQNKYSFAVSDIYVEKFDGFVDLSIFIANDSPKTHTLENLVFLDENKNEIKSLELPPPKPLYSSLENMSFDYLDNPINSSVTPGKLKKPEVMLPYKHLEFSYNLVTMPKYIKVISNKRINKIHKYVLISTDTYQHD
ncbi:hypothetical protein BU586_02000 [Staphylococcus agnetis]|uniref:Uncharacterized protein n=1 Tax=Staphylococcus agnetis TaxID=985762 RepID=A0ABD7TV71_9STAP|nr:hypothetical protein [Staphylococcus agnetis]PTH70876.1 hypothetical protein BU586_02000 [Staphylococcus agnetis]UXU56845.1 hypothetical protein MUA95_09795 [Staphylococcus agnetis]